MSNVYLQIVTVNGNSKVCIHTLKSIQRLWQTKNLDFKNCKKNAYVRKSKLNWIPHTILCVTWIWHSHCISWQQTYSISLQPYCAKAKKEAIILATHYIYMDTYVTSTPYGGRYIGNIIPIYTLDHWISISAKNQKKAWTRSTAALTGWKFAVRNYTYVMCSITLIIVSTCFQGCLTSNTCCIFLYFLHLSKI